MKTAILSAALMLASTVAMAQKSNFQLKVDLKNFNSDSVLVYKGRNVKMDTVLVKNKCLSTTVSCSFTGMSFIGSNILKEVPPEWLFRADITPP